MARTVNEQEYAIKRNEILDVAQRLVYTKGYEQMAIRDILDEIQISKGAFYHYFDSKPDLLEALVDRIRQELEKLLIPIIQDPALPALKKIQHFFDTSGRWKIAHKAYMLALLQIWYNDDNAIVRQKMQASMIRHITPWLTHIVNQGIDEGVLSTPFPDQVGNMLLFLWQGLGQHFAEFLLAPEPTPNALQQIERVVAAYNYALERLLGAPAGSLNLADTEILREWFG